MPKRIVIVGGGFGGVYSLLSIRRYLKKTEHQTTIISDNKYFSFTPFLTEVAANILSSDEASTPIANIIKNDREEFVQDKVGKIDLKDKKVFLINGYEIPYDYLVIAIGSTTNFMNVGGAEKYTLVLKDIDDAVHIREEIDKAFEEASKLEDPQKRRMLLTFAIIGGGPTGIELAANMEEHVSNLLEDKYQSIPKSDTCVEILNSGEHIIKEMPIELQTLAEELVKKENICLRTNSRVKTIESNTITLTDGTQINANKIIWAAGVKANKIEIQPQDVLDIPSNKFIVNEFLQLKSFPEVFAIGDDATLDGDSQKMPMLAQAALSEGVLVGKNIAKAIRGRRLISFEFHSKGELVSIGKGEAVANVYGINISGKIAWFMWKLIYLFKFIDMKQKPAILYRWFLELVG